MSKEKTLLGFRRFTSKNNKPCCIATVGTKFDEKDNERGSVGMSAENVFLPAELYNYLGINDIGKPLSMNYNIVNGRAYINEFIVEREPVTETKK